MSTLRSAISEALTRAQPPSAIVRLETRNNRVVSVLDGVVVQSWKRRPSETVQDAFNRVMAEKVRTGEIRAVLSSSSDDCPLSEEDLN